MTDALNILLIEDNPGDVRLIREMLSESGAVGFNLESAAELSAGIMKLSQKPFDAVLLDLNLSDSTGTATFTELHERCPKIPIVILTGLLDEEMGALAVTHGIQDYLIKGKIDPDLLVRSLRYAIERHHLEEKLQKAFAEEHKLRQQLEEEAKNRIRFIDVLAHELKGPLTPMLTSSAMIQDNITINSDPVLKQLADYFFNGTKLLNSRLEELLDVARFARGVVTFNKGATDIRNFIEQVVSRYTPSIARRKQQLIVEMEAALPSVNLDQSRLEQVIINLLSNASKYSPEGSRILLTAGINNSNLLVSVKDEGMGISTEDQAVLFQPYQRVGKEQGKVQGLGLGLTVVKAIVEAHGGQIWVESETGKGSTFSFSIPLKQDSKGV